MFNTLMHARPVFIAKLNAQFVQELKEQALDKQNNNFNVKLF